ncbi:MAG: CFI-box-CTERM domain-containing protein [Candidatus Promineifilaceae bacterium]|nr:CFI-box-CTERM domain-containing protein [Candidatus Promineifilaceae bacterium]
MKHIKLEATDRTTAYAAYQRDQGRLRRLNRSINNLERDLYRLQLEQPDADPARYVKGLAARRDELQRRVYDYSKRFMRDRAVEQDEEDSGEQKADIIYQFLGSNNNFASLLDNTSIQYAADAECRHVHEISSVPTALLSDQKVAADSNATGTLNPSGIAGSERNSVICSGNVSDDNGFFEVFNSGVLGAATVVHQYEIPAPPCDCLVVWYFRFFTGITNLNLTADSGFISISPLWVHSPSGITPTFETFLNNVHFEHIKSIDVVDGISVTVPGTQLPFGDPFTVKGSYDVQAGVTSHVYFGIEVKFEAVDGTNSGVTAGSIVFPPGATLTNPQVQPLFWPPRPGVQYLMFPKTSGGGCYISTAVCTALGKPDDCYELELLRHYRDTSVRSLAGGDELIAHYYAAAPRLVARMQSRPDSEQILQYIYKRFLAPCLRNIERDRGDESLATYLEMVSFAENLA